MWKDISTAPRGKVILISGFRWTESGKVSKTRYQAVCKQMYKDVFADPDEYQESGAEYTNVTHWQPLQDMPI